MFNIKSAATTFAALIALAAPATATTITYGEQIFELPVPAGHCKLKPSNRVDAQILKVISTKDKDIKMLAAHMDCKALRRWHKNQSPDFDRVSTYQRLAAPLAAMDDAALADIVEQTCNTFRSERLPTIDLASHGENEWLNDYTKDMKVGSQRSLGLLDEDDTTCYMGMVTARKSYTNTKKFVVVVVAATFVNGQPFYYTLNGPYNRPESVIEVLQQAKAAVQEFAAANYQ